MQEHLGCPSMKRLSKTKSELDPICISIPAKKVCQFSQSKNNWIIFMQGLFGPCQQSLSNKMSWINLLSHTTAFPPSRILGKRHSMGGNRMDNSSNFSIFLGFHQHHLLSQVSSREESSDHQAKAATIRVPRCWAKPSCPKQPFPIPASRTLKAALYRKIIGLIKKKNEFAFKFYYLWYTSSNLK